MKALYLRNAIDDVVRRLLRLGDRDGTSVGAVSVRELSDVACRADKSALVGELPHPDVAVPGIVESVERARDPVIALDASTALSGLLNAGPASK